MSNMNPDLIKAGVDNLVNHCAKVTGGERVLIVNARGKVEPELAALIQKAVETAGAFCEYIWIDPVHKEVTILPPTLVRAIEVSDKIIFNGSISRVLLNRYLKDRDVVEINNYYLNSHAMCAADARFDWRELRCLFTSIEQSFLGAKKWSITTTMGTELSGHIAGATDVSQAFFVKSGDSLRKRRVFPGEVFSPVGVMGAEGKVAVQYINELDDLAWDDPVIAVIRNGRVSALEGDGPHRGVLERLLEEKQQVYGDQALMLDSWHGGMNPEARVPSIDDPRLEGARTSPALMHVHLGSQLDTISAGMLNAIVEVDGKKIFEQGRCLLFE